MSKALQWVLGVSAVVLTLAIVASLVVPFFLPQAAVAGWRGMGGPGHMFGSGPMMGGFGRSVMGGWAMFGLGRLLWPLLMVGLIVLGVVWLIRAVSAPRMPAAAVTPAAVPSALPTPCAHCGQPLQAGWKACPYCGEMV
jgi:hypothetical protein